MTNKQAIEILKHDCYVFNPLDFDNSTCINRALDVAVKALEQESKIDRLYSWLNDMRLGIAPDETTPQNERDERLAQVDVIDDIMEWLESEG